MPIKPGNFGAWNIFCDHTDEVDTHVVIHGANYYLVLVDSASDETPVMTLLHMQGDEEIRTLVEPDDVIGLECGATYTFKIGGRFIYISVTR